MIEQRWMEGGGPDECPGSFRVWRTPPREMEREIGVYMTTRGRSADAVRTGLGTTALTACVVVHTAGVR